MLAPITARRSFNWKLQARRRHDRAVPQPSCSSTGYRFQFITLAGWHALNHSMCRARLRVRPRGMAAYADFQQREFASEAARLHRNAPPARSRHRLLRRSPPKSSARQFVDDGSHRLHRRSAVHSRTRLPRAQHQRGASSSPRSNARRRGLASQKRMRPARCERVSFGLDPRSS